MGRGKSGLAGSGDSHVTNILRLMKSGQTIAAGDVANNEVETAGYFMYENNGDVFIYGKNYNNNFSNIAPGSRGMDADGMASTIVNNSGKWSTHRFDGQVQFPASALSKRAGNGFMNAIIIEKQPTNAPMKKIVSTPDGSYDIFEVKGASNNAMFRFVAIRK